MASPSAASEERNEWRATVKSHGLLVSFQVWQQSCLAPPAAGPQPVPAADGGWCCCRTWGTQSGGKPRNSPS